MKFRRLLLGRKVMTNLYSIFKSRDITLPTKVRLVKALPQGIWVWVNSGSRWWTGRPGVLRFMRSQRVGHDWPTELNWTELNWTEAPLSMVFFRQEYWSRLPCPPPGDLHKPEIESVSLLSPALAGRFFTRRYICVEWVWLGSWWDVEIVWNSALLWVPMFHSA